MKRSHAIFRAYISLARGEHYVPSELGELADEETEGSILAQLDWTENAELKKMVCQVKQMTDAEFFKRGIIAKPSTIANLVYSSEIRRAFDVSEIEGFDKRGNFILPQGRGFFVPQLQGIWITSLKFYGMGVLKVKEAV